MRTVNVVLLFAYFDGEAVANHRPRKGWVWRLWSLRRNEPLEKRKSMRKRLPDWFKTSLPTGVAQARFNGTKGNVVEHGLNTVCEEARCPNIHDCWGRGTATFMIAGEVCTRGCRFCAVGTVRTPPDLTLRSPENWRMQ